MTQVPPALEAVQKHAKSLLFEGGPEDHWEYMLSGTCLVAMKIELQESLDLELARIALELCTDEQRAFVAAVDLEALRPDGPGCGHFPGKRIVLPGFPFDRKEIRADERVLAMGRVVHGGVIDGSDGLRRIHRASLDMPAAHPSLNRMSGAPVFGYGKIDCNKVCTSFDGIVITASPNGIARFICSSAACSSSSRRRASHGPVTSFGPPFTSWMRGAHPRGDA